MTQKFTRPTKTEALTEHLFLAPLEIVRNCSYIVHIGSYVIRDDLSPLLVPSPSSGKTSMRRTVTAG